MALPNMAMIPSGYKPTKLYSVLPTPALSDVELVANGDFSNGLTGWSGSDMTVSNEQLMKNGPSLNYQGGVIENNKTYKITIDVPTLGNGLRVYAGGTQVNLIQGVNTLKVSSSNTNDFVGFNGGNGSIINSISVKEFTVADADFTVTRASSATRVNKEGLIETPEFIIGGDVVVNGDFSSVGVWVTNTGWSISGGVCVGTSVPTSEAVYQTPLIIGKRYRITVDLVSVISGGIKERIGNTSNTIERTTVGTYSFERVADSTVLGIIAGSNGFTGTIDNVSVIQVERDNIPRLDYTYGGCPVLLTEPQSTNLITDSEDFSDSGWSNSGSSVVGGFSSPSADSTLGAFKLVEDSSTNHHRIHRDASLTINDEVSFSIYAKKGERNKIGIAEAGVEGYSLAIDLRDGSLVIKSSSVTYSVESLVNEWYRITFSYTVTASGNHRFFINSLDDAYTTGSTWSYSYAGDGASGIYLFGAQLEPLSYSTSYMPTYGEIASRATETVSNAGDANTFNSTEGVLFAEIYPTFNSGSRQITINDGSYNNRIVIEVRDSGGTIRALTTSGGVNQVDISYTASSLSSPYKVAIKYKLNDVSFWVNGLQIGSTDTSATMPIGLEKLSLAGNNVNGLPFYGKTSQVQVFNTALSDYELKLLTGGDANYDSYEEMRLALNYNIQ